jgi:hypothetical protein
MLLGPGCTDAASLGCVLALLLQLLHLLHENRTLVCPLLPYLLNAGLSPCLQQQREGMQNTSYKLACASHSALSAATVLLAHKQSGVALHRQHLTCNLFMGPTKQAEYAYPGVGDGSGADHKAAARCVLLAALVVFCFLHDWATHLDACC